jgi:aspartate--ammonia ligase
MPGKRLITMLDKKADLAGPGIGNYDELEKILPKNYTSLLNTKDTQKAIFTVKQYVEEHLSKELNLMMVTTLLIYNKWTGNHHKI